MLKARLFGWGAGGGALWHCLVKPASSFLEAPLTANTWATAGASSNDLHGEKHAASAPPGGWVDSRWWVAI